LKFDQRVEKWLAYKQNCSSAWRNLEQQNLVIVSRCRPAGKPRIGIGLDPAELPAIVMFGENRNIV
jgi:hypothetical protein